MHPFQKIKEYICKNKLLQPGDKVIVGVSGGPDSVFLLHLLHQWQHDLGITLHVAHINHRLRKDADKDQRFVETLAHKLNIPVSTVIWKRKRQGLSSIEERARLYRLRCFQQLAKQQKTPIIAIAHTQDDLAETVLMRLIRGTGLQGLRAMRPYSQYEKLQIIRPLLGTRKEDIIFYLKKHKVPYCVDITNQDTKFFRNKIRHKLLPLLAKDFNPRIFEMLANFVDISANDYAFMEGQADRLFPGLLRTSRLPTSLRISLSALHKHPLALQRLLVRKAIERLQGDTRRLTLTHMKEVEDLLAHRKQGSRVHLPQKITVLKDKKSLTITRP